MNSVCAVGAGSREINLLATRHGATACRTTVMTVKRAYVRLFPAWAMDFDHVSGDKRFEVSRAKRLGRRSILAEASKCEIVCANCHRDRTHKRLTSRP